MKCQYCGAEIENLKVCKYCSSRISYNERRELEQVNKSGCPRCKSSAVKFNREYLGDTFDFNSRRKIIKTVGFCQDCGFTWYIDEYHSYNRNMQAEQKLSYRGRLDKLHNRIRNCIDTIKKYFKIWFIMYIILIIVSIFISNMIVHGL